MIQNALKSALLMALLVLAAVARFAPADAYCAEHEAICITGCCTEGECPCEESEHSEHGEPPCCLEVGSPDDPFLASGLARLDPPRVKDLPAGFGDIDAGFLCSGNLAAVWISDRGPPVSRGPCSRVLLGVYLL